MTGNNHEENGLSSQPGSEPKTRRKDLSALKPIVVPDSCKTTPDGSLDSPWMRLGYDIGLNLTDARTPEHKNHQGNPKPTCQLKENASADELKHTCSKKKVPSIEQKRAATSSFAAFAPKRPKKSGVERDMAPSGSNGKDAVGSYIGHWSRSRTDSNIEGLNGSSSDLDDDKYPAEDAYQYGAGDDDAEDEYATIYDGDDQGAKMRRY